MICGSRLRSIDFLIGDRVLAVGLGASMRLVVVDGCWKYCGKRVINIKLGRE